MGEWNIHLARKKVGTSHGPRNRIYVTSFFRQYNVFCTNEKYPFSEVAKNTHRSQIWHARTIFQLAPFFKESFRKQFSISSKYNQTIINVLYKSNSPKQSQITNNYLVNIPVRENKNNTLWPNENPWSLNASNKDPEMTRIPKTSDPKILPDPKPDRKSGSGIP